MVFAKSMSIFLNERSFFTFFAPLTCLDHIPFKLLLFGPTRSAKKLEFWHVHCLRYLPLKFTFMTWGYAQPAPFHKHVIPLNRGATSAVVVLGDVIQA